MREDTLTVSISFLDKLLADYGLQVVKTENNKRNEGRKPLGVLADIMNHHVVVALSLCRPLGAADAADFKPPRRREVEERLDKAAREGRVLRPQPPRFKRIEDHTDKELQASILSAMEVLGAKEFWETVHGVDAFFEQRRRKRRREEARRIIESGGSTIFSVSTPSHRGGALDDVEDTDDGRWGRSS